MLVQVFLTNSSSSCSIATLLPSDAFAGSCNSLQSMLLQNYFISRSIALTSILLICNAALGLCSLRFTVAFFLFLFSLCYTFSLSSSLCSLASTLHLLWRMFVTVLLIVINEEAFSSSLLCTIYHFHFPSHLWCLFM